jgi:chorismate mutase / prephenate dehydratase
MANPDAILGELRREIDEIDSALHDLIMRRTAIVERVGEVKRGASGAPADRAAQPNPRGHLPGREAEILRRLAERHRGAFPKPALLRIWRELISALSVLQSPMAIAVYLPPDRPGYWDIARDHYGSQTPMTAHASPMQVLRALNAGTATVGILPLPQQDDPDPWWRALIGADNGLPRILARLPFGGAGNHRGESLEALAIGFAPLEPTGHDRTLLAVETMREVSRSAFKNALAPHGLEPLSSLTWRDPAHPDAWFNLIEIDGFAEGGDGRFAALCEELPDVVRHVTRLGGYPVPFNAAELSRAAAS